MSRYRLVVGLAAIVGLGVACGEDEEPPVLPNPAGITAQVNLFRAVVNTPAMQSLGALAIPMETFGLSLADLANPAMQGQTIEWNVTTDVLDSTARAGAPANATRVILYAINAATRRPVEPLVEVGYVDLFAHSDFPDSSSVRFLVSDSSAVPIVLADFLAHAHDNTGDTARVNGFVSNGTGRFDFAFPYRALPATQTVFDGNLDLVSPASRIRHRSSLEPSTDSAFAAQVIGAVDGDSVTSISYMIASASGALTGDQDVGVGGLSGPLFAHATRTAGGVTATGPGGRALTAEERAAIDAMHFLALDFALNVQRPILTTYHCGC